MWSCLLFLLLCSLSFPLHSGFSATRVLRSRPSRRSPNLAPLASSAADSPALVQQLQEEAKEVYECLSLAVKAVLKSEKEVQVDDILQVCDQLEGLTPDTDLLANRLELRRRALEYQRYEYLAKLMTKDYDGYVKTASFLSPSRIPRLQLPNVEDVPYDASREPTTAPQDADGDQLVADCELDKMKYEESPLDKLLLSLFRKLVTEHTRGVTSAQPGIEGLLEQGRTYMLQVTSPEDQHKMVVSTLKGLMTPVLPPFYRIFMSGIFPKLGTDLDGKQLGPWFYAPWLTTIVTPTFFGFLVGPSRPNRRKDGQLGGLVVEKCKFLQESGCKGLCLHQCKLPAQQFFQDELGLPLTVSPNFETQECQWSFGQEPLDVADDPSFPKGCLAGCESRQAMKGTQAELCSY